MTSSFLMLMYQNCDFSADSPEACNPDNGCYWEPIETYKIDWDATMKPRLIFSTSANFPNIIEEEGTEFLSSSTVFQSRANQSLFLNIAHLTEFSKVCVYDLSESLENHCVYSDGSKRPENFYDLRQSQSIHSIEWSFEQRLEETYFENQPYLVDFPSWQAEYPVKLGDEKVIYFYEVSSKSYYGPYSFKITAPKNDVVFRDEMDVAGTSKEFYPNDVLINFTKNFSENIFVCEIIVLKDQHQIDESQCLVEENYQAINSSESKTVLDRADIEHNHKSWAEDLSQYHLSQGDKILRFYIDKNWFPGEFIAEGEFKTYLKKEILFK